MLVGVTLRAKRTGVPEVTFGTVVTKVTVFVGCSRYANAPEVFRSADMSYLVICVKINSPGQSIIGGPPA